MGGGRGSRLPDSPEQLWDVPIEPVTVRESPIEQYLL